MSHEPPKSAIDEFKGKQGLTRLINALGYSKDGLSVPSTLPAIETLE